MAVREDEQRTVSFEQRVEMVARGIGPLETVPALCRQTELVKLAGSMQVDRDDGIATGVGAHDAAARGAQDLMWLREEGPGLDVSAGDRARLGSGVRRDVDELAVVEPTVRQGQGMTAGLP